LTDRLAAEARGQSQNEFASAHPYPFLLVWVSRAEEDAAFLTIAQADLAAPECDELMAPIEKRAGANAFSYVTVGRAANNDIVIESPEVSKCHAVFEFRGGNCTIADAGSKNGTFVNGKQLAPQQPLVVRAGDDIVFAQSVKAQVLDARSAYRWLLTAV
jgi:hypothetical protein